MTMPRHSFRYVVAEIVELAGNAANDMKTKRLTPRHLKLAVKGDDEIDCLFRNVTIAGGGKRRPFKAQWSLAF